MPRLLDDDEDDVGDGTGRWSFAIVALERNGRVTLPYENSFSLVGVS